ncbi:MAG TPA: twin-arginine translocation signal domain-containing protein, partial [Candidatus Hydrogenedentes bacterium]|nr:twin-arginine translocation signal domain-containing protein [Candidatus Hydrogenedentota bacterium]
MSCLNRRDFLRAAAATVGSGIALQAVQPGAEATVWQIDPALCVQCGRCATNCVINPSAIKYIHSYPICGYCDLCGA